MNRGRAVHKWTYCFVGGALALLISLSYASTAPDVQVNVPTNDDSEAVTGAAAALPPGGSGSAAHAGRSISRTAEAEKTARNFMAGAVKTRPMTGCPLKKKSRVVM